MRARVARREWLGGALLLVAEGSWLFPRSVGAEDGDPDARTAPRQLAGRSEIGRFSTSYENDAEHRSRAVNVELAAQAIDGSAMPPHGVFSFNDVVGDRTLAFGYERSLVLRGPLLTEGMGGGTCQVASTLHAAALLAGLDVVARTAHSRPSAYIRMGLDATVVFPQVDLKLRNPLRARVVVRASAARGSLSVWLEADEPTRPRVVIVSEIAERIPFARTLVRDPRVPDGEVHVRTYGIPGYRVDRTREVTRETATRVDRQSDVYPPVSETLVASPSFDAARLDLQGDEDTPDGPLRPAIFRDEAGVRKPALVQLRPSTRVEIQSGT